MRNDREGGEKGRKRGGKLGEKKEDGGRKERGKDEKQQGTRGERKRGGK